MLIFSNSMCKSASTAIWWYTEQLLYKHASRNGFEKLCEMTSNNEIKGVGAFVEHPLTDDKVDKLLKLAGQEGPTIVKIHCELTPRLKQLIEAGDATATFCYRDPRDMILSAMDHRVRAQKQGREVFNSFTSVAASLKETEFWCKLAIPWIENDRVQKFLYNDTVSNPGGQLRKIARFFNVDVSQNDIDEILAREQKKRVAGWNEFNQANLTRYKSEMTRQEIALCNERLGAWISELGFDVDSEDETEKQCSAAHATGDEPSIVFQTK